MQKVTLLVQQILPIIDTWIRATINDEVSKALEADRIKKKPERQYSRNEVCKILGISLPTLWAKTKSGEIKATHIGRRVMYSESEVNRICGK